jgi:hypothetical protein
MASSAQTNIHVLAGSIGPSRIAKPAALLAIALTVIALLLLASLHVLSPEFAPSWRMISEYALGRYGWVLSLMFLAMGLSSWAIGAAVWRQVQTAAGKVGLWFLIAAGLGGAMASVFDVTRRSFYRQECFPWTAGRIASLCCPIARGCFLPAIKRSHCAANTRSARRQ